MIYVIGFLVPFVSVFTKVIQQQNIINQRKALAAVTSFVLVALDISMIGLVVNNGWHMLVPAGCGGALGVTLSLYLYPKIIKSRRKPTV